MISEESRWEEIGRARERMLTVLRLQANPDAIRPFRPSTLSAAGSGTVSRYTVRPGDTVQSAARRNNCQPADIISLNRLRFPFVNGDTDTAAPGVKVRGETLIVPGTGAAAEPAVTRADTSQERNERTYYLGARLIEADTDPGKYDLAVKGGDFDMFTGPALVTQSVSIMLQCPQGWEPDYPLHGRPELIGEPADRNALSLFNCKLRGAVRLDDRIARADKLETRYAAETQDVAVDMLLQYKGGETAPVSGSVRA